MRKSMTTLTIWVTIWIALPCLVGLCEGRNDPRQRKESSIRTLRRGTAAVALARAALTIVDERPVLPDVRPLKEIAADLRLDPAIVDPPNSPMSIEFTPATRFDNELPAQLVVGHWVSGCPAGERQERDIRRILTPLGWKMGHAATDQIQFVAIPQNEACPQLTLYQNGLILRSWQGYQDPALLSRELRRAWDTASTSQQHVATTGSAGIIRARSQIHHAFVWWRETLGEGTKASLCWDRTGAQTFPLLARGDWSAEALFGRSGRIEVSLTDARAIPINSIGFAYRVLQEDISIDIDPILLKGLASHFGPGIPVTDPPQQAFSDSRETLVPQIGPMTIWTIASMIRDLFKLLHPTCDLQLGGNISATCELMGDVLAVDFQQAPSIKLVALFTFQLSVERIEITEQSVRLKFGGSRLVKERTFDVK